jgi:hypothetical protein
MLVLAATMVVACGDSSGLDSTASTKTQSAVQFPCTELDTCVVVEDNCGCENSDGNKIAIPEDRVEEYRFTTRCNLAFPNAETRDPTCDAIAASCVEGVCELMYQ